MGIIEPSKSPFCSPLLLIKKTDGSLRPMVDFRLLNRGTVFDAEPMPSPEEIYSKLHKGKKIQRSISAKDIGKFL